MPDTRYRVTIGGCGLRPGVSRVLLVAVLLSVAGCDVFTGGEKPTPPPGALTPSPGAVAISRRCSGSRWIEPAGPGDEAEWSRVTIAERSGCFSLAATDEDRLGVGVDTAFILESEEDLDPAALGSLVRTEPSIGLVVAREEARSGGPASAPIAPRAASAAGPVRYRLTPEQPLASGQLYRVVILDRPDGLPVQTWSFEARQPLRVVHTIPGDESADVPLDTGIELSFSYDGVTGVESAFHIDPPTQGRFETHKRTVVFVPAKLQPATLYTVELDAGVRIADTDTAMVEGYRFSFETTQREAATDQRTGLHWSQAMWEHSSADAPVLSAYGWGEEPGAFGGQTVRVKVYRYPDLDAFATAVDGYAAIPSWSWRTRDSYRAATEGLALAASFDAQLEALGEYGEYVVRFPEPLPAGWYVAELEREQTPMQAWLQVTDIGAYVAESGPRTLAWVNDMVGGEPIAGATIGAYGGEALSATGADGVAVFDTPASIVRTEDTDWGDRVTSAQGSLVVSDGTRMLLVALGDLGGGRSGPMREFILPGDQNLYWRYVYADRPLYHQTDTVRFWGVARARDGAAALDTLTVRIRGGDYAGYDYEPLALAQDEVALGPAGTFLGSLELVGATPGYYSLEVRSGEVTIASTSLEVRDFIKPAYQIDVEASTTAALVGDEVRLGIQASFFEGSPVPLLDLTVAPMSDTPAAVTTDEGGHAAYTATVPVSLAEDAKYSGYAWYSVTVVPVGQEEGDIGAATSLQVFPATLTVSGEGVIGDDGLARVAGSVHAVDMARVLAGGASSVDDYLGPAVAGHKVTARVTEYTYTRVKIGESYDFVAKKVVPRYRYDQVETPLGPFDAVTGDDGTFELSFPAAQDAGYEVELAVTDDDGRVALRQAYVGRAYPPSSEGQLSLEAEQDEPYSIGDTVSVVLRTGSGEAVADPASRYLFMRARNGIRDYVVGEEARYAFTFAAEHVPNVNVIAVRFTGTTYQEAPMSVVARFDQEDRALNVAVSADAERYGPGDTATLSVRTTDDRGDPMAATVLLSAVDEAIFRAQAPWFQDALGIRKSLYASAPSGLLRTYPSHQLPTGVPGAEGGGGGEGRADLRDVALFEEVRTNASGQGKVSFRLPDNLTSWRVTAQAVSQDLHAGSSTLPLPVSLPLFVDVTMNTEYLLADHPVIRLRAFGNALAPGDEVSFEVDSDSLLAEPLRATGTAFDSVDVALPDLKEGQHELAVSASAAGLSDKLIRSISVVESRLTAVGTDYAELPAGSTYDPGNTSAARATLVVADASRARYYPFLERQSAGTGDRLDQRLSRHLAQDLRVRYAGASADSVEDFHPGAYQTAVGGIALFPYSDAELDLSASAVAAAPSLFGREALVGYFSAVVTDPDETPERVLTALYGLATLGESVLGDLRALAADAATPLRPEQRLTLGLAMAAAGDQSAAFGLYRGLVEEFGQARGDAVRLNVGTDQDDILRSTARAAVLAAMLGDGYAPALFAYTESNASRETLVVLEQCTFVGLALPKLDSQGASFAYTRFGQREEVTLAPGDHLSLSLAPEELDALSLTVASGAVGVARSTRTPVGVGDLTVDPELALTRTYLVNGQTAADEPIPIAEGDEVLVRLDWRLGDKAVDGCYQISDLLPSGLRPITAIYDPTRYYGDENLASPYAIDGQRVSFCVTKGSKQIPAYLVRVLGKGTYAAEPALIQSQASPQSLNLTGAREVRIR